MQEFSSRMKFITFLMCVPLVHSELHTFITTYTGISGQNFTGIPEFFAVTTLDDQQIDYYDSDTKKLIPKQNWMKEFVSKGTWIEDTEIREDVQQIYKNNIRVLMQQFNHSHGVHTYQRMYGCMWDDETEVSQGFDQYGYDGEDFILLDLEELRYITPVPQGLSTVQKWNNNRAQLESLKQYYDYECVYWLKEFLALNKVDLERRAPQVFLLKKYSSYTVGCHATGFYPSGVTYTWYKNGQEHHENVDLGELLPNEDGTFQKTSYLRLTREEWSENRYACVVKHMGKTFLKTEDESDRIIVVVVLVGLLFLVIGASVCCCIMQQKRISYYKWYAFHGRWNDGE